MLENGKKLDDAELSGVSGGVSYGPYFQYTVVGDDTLSSIALRFDTTVDILLELNSPHPTDLINDQCTKKTARRRFFFAYMRL